MQKVHCGRKSFLLCTLVIFKHDFQEKYLLVEVFTKATIV
jgi:hypothetical protein